jgi:hypothetical protein
MLRPMRLSSLKLLQTCGFLGLGASSDLVGRVDLGGSRSLPELFNHSKRRSNWGLYLLLVPEPRPGL